MSQISNESQSRVNRCNWGLCEMRKNQLAKLNRFVCWVKLGLIFFGPGKLWVKKVRPKIFLSMFLLNWTISRSFPAELDHSKNCFSLCTVHWQRTEQLFHTECRTICALVLNVQSGTKNFIEVEIRTIRRVNHIVFNCRAAH